MNLDVNEIMKKAERDNEKKDNWVVTIKGYDDYGDPHIKVVSYKNDIDFLQEGLPAALIATRLAGKDFSKYTISDVYYDENDWIIPREICEFSDEEPATVTKGSKKYDLTVISDDEIKDIIKNFLTSDIFCEGDFDDKFIRKVTNEIIPSRTKVKK